MIKHFDEALSVDKKVRSENVTRKGLQLEVTDIDEGFIYERNGVKVTAIRVNHHDHYSSRARVLGPAKNAIGCAMVCENIMLAAVSLGLGSCYDGFGAMVTHNTDVVKTLELEDGERIYGPVIIGYPKIDPSESQVKTLAELRPKKKEPIIKWI